MPIIAFANSKGGSGKTTSALLLACELAESKPVTIIDADPRRPITSWAGQHPKQIEAGQKDPKAEAKRVQMASQVPANITVIPSAGENTIIDEIDAAAQNSVFVIIDLEGVASKLVSFALSQSDFVIVPMKEQKQDADAALDIILEVHRAMKVGRRKIPYAVLFTQTKYIKSRTARHVAMQLRNAENIDCFETEIDERDAYSAVFSTGGSVRALDRKKVNNLDKAIGNIESYTHEVISRLRALRDTDNQEVA